jgi:hypothetical protein
MRQKLRSYAKTLPESQSQSVLKSTCCSTTRRSCHRILVWLSSQRPRSHSSRLVVMHPFKTFYVTHTHTQLVLVASAAVPVSERELRTSLTFTIDVGPSASFIFGTSALRPPFFLVRSCFHPRAVMLSAHTFIHFTYLFCAFDSVR